MTWKPSRFIQISIDGAEVDEDNADAPADLDGTAACYIWLGVTSYSSNALDGNEAEILFFDEYNPEGLEKVVNKLRAKYDVYADDDTGGDFSNGFSKGFTRTDFDGFSSGFASGFGDTTGR